MAFSLAWGGLLAAVGNVGAGNFGVNGVTGLCVVATILGAVMTDLDNPRAPAARMMPVVARAVSRRFPHRTLLHSFAGLGASSGIVWGLLWLASVAGLPLHGLARTLAGFFGWGWLSHLILDTLTKRGVPYFWPLLSDPLWYPTLEEDRLISGDGRWNLIITIGSLALFAALVPVMRQGAGTTLANTIGQAPQLAEVYRGAVGREVALTFEGYWERDRSRVGGRALILAEKEDVFTIWLDGEVRELGQSRGELRLLSGQVEVLEQGPRVLVRTHDGRPLEDIVAGLGPDPPSLGYGEASNSQILVSGELTADRTFALGRPLAGRGIAATAASVRMEFARLSDVRTVRTRPKESGEGMAKLQEERVRSQARVDSLVAARQRTRALYDRDRLFVQVREERGKVEKLEKELAEQARADTVVRFSGQVEVRTVPAF